MSVTKAQLVGNVSTGASFAGIVTATSFSGNVTGTATTTTNIPNLTGAITSVNTTTSLGSFSSANLATALTDETGSGANVFAISPTLVTPVLGAATATSLNVSGVVTATSFSGSGANLTGVSTNFVTAIGIQSAGTVIGAGITQLNFIGAGNTFAVNGTTVNISIAGGGGGGSSQWISGATGIYTSSNVSIGTTNVGLTSFYVNGSSASNIVAVGTASTITLGFATANNFTFTIDGNYILGNPTGMTTGQSGVIYIVQDSTGGRSIGFGSFWRFVGGVAPSIGIASNSVNALAYSVRNLTSIPANILVSLANTSGVI